MRKEGKQETERQVSRGQLTQDLGGLSDFTLGKTGSYQKILTEKWDITDFYIPDNHSSC